MLASMNIQIITQAVKTCSPLLQESTRYRIMGWKRAYHRILNLIQELDEILGPTLLTMVTKQLIIFVLSRYEITLVGQAGKILILRVFYCVSNLIFFMILVIGSQQIKTKVSCLEMLRFRDESLHSTYFPNRLRI